MGIADYYAVEKENPRAARRIVEAIEETCRRAGEDPQLGEARPDLGTGIRSKRVLQYRFRVYFRPASPRSHARVQIIRILHQAQDVDRAFRRAF